MAAGEPKKTCRHQLAVARTAAWRESTIIDKSVSRLSHRLIIRQGTESFYEGEIFINKRCKRRVTERGIVAPWRDKIATDRQYFLIKQKPRFAVRTLLGIAIGVLHVFQKDEITWS